MKNGKVEDALSRLCGVEGEWKRMRQGKILGKKGNIKFLTLPRHVKCNFWKGAPDSVA